MKLAICHYSLRRTWETQGWNCLDLARHVRDLGVPAIDFHTRYIGDTPPAEIIAALKETGLVLSGLSFSNNFLKDDPDELEAEVRKVESWIDLAGAIGAPVSRIFGGHLPPEVRHDQAERQRHMNRLLAPLERVTARAEKVGLVLAMENHGGLPATSGEIVAMIERIGSDHLRSTCDTGNFLQAGQEPVDGARGVARYAAYAHIKDFRKLPDTEAPLGYRIEAAVVGDGDVDNAGCLEALHQAGFDGYVALEYEGAAEESSAVPQSLDHMRSLLGRYGG